jgi:hypothetical protein
MTEQSRMVGVLLGGMNNNQQPGIENAGLLIVFIEAFL